MNKKVMVEKTMVVVGGVIPAQDYQFYLMLTVAVFWTK
jgi:methylmalonyl-CoA mutase cobalamin-binding subunit